MKGNDSQECLGGRNKVAIKTSFSQMQMSILHPQLPPPTMPVQPVQRVQGFPRVPVAVLMAVGLCSQLHFAILTTPVL